MKRVDGEEQKNIFNNIQMIFNRDEKYFSDDFMKFHFFKIKRSRYNKNIKNLHFTEDGQLFGN
jgi:ABC-type oligopeptide transport system ATPase subunit